MSNQVLAKKAKQTFSVAMQSEPFQRFINQAFQDQRKRENYVAGILSAVSVNPTLQQCTPMSVLTASVLGETLGLSHSTQMGQYYIVPYNKKYKDENGNDAWQKVGQFQIGLN